MNCSISDRTTKVFIVIVAVVMGDTDLSVPTTNLAIRKAEKIFQTEHLVMGAYDYATTALTTLVLKSFVLVNQRRGTRT